MAKFRVLKPFLIIVALLCGLLPLLSSAASADPDCPDVLVLGSRGSGEDAAGYDGLGKPVEAFWREFRPLVPAGKTVKVWPNPYRAVAVMGPFAWVNGLLTGASNGNWFLYKNSVRDGVTKLRQEITDRVAACGTRTQLVLAGYSQGGQVTAEVYENLPATARDRVLGMVLFGEPKFNSESVAAEGNFEVGRNGSLGTRAEYQHPGPVLSYCHALDPVCQGFFDFNRRLPKKLAFDGAQHTNYPTLGDSPGGATYPLQAARSFASKLRPAPPAGTPTAVITPVDAAVVGERFAITAAQSQDPQDRKLTYAWDLDDSGQFATVTPCPIVHATFTSPGGKRIGLRVTNDAGQSATTHAVIGVFDPDNFTGPPGKPTSVTATASADQTKATLSWNAPADGSPAEAYEVLTSDGDLFDYVDHGGSASITLNAADLPVSLMVRATNRVGNGAPSDPVAVSVAGPGKPSGDLNELWNTYGDQGGHWTGGDRTASVRLPDGRTAWLFSDTFLGTVNPDHSRPANTPMPRNTLVVQNANGSLGTTLHGGTTQAPRSLVEVDGSSTVYWVGDGIVEGGALKVLYNRYETTGGGGLDVQTAGTSLATFSLPDLRLTELRALPLSANVAWGSEIVTDGGFTYVYGSEDVTDGPKAAKVARTTSVGGTWEF
ncbi:cutinase family protein [Lentzea sp. NPDC102401]|uniref:cutinase family protein n=1 Tax=Lentzea sp. NPDC102401 TaxID=3364128 RepID=UPI00382959C9